VENYQPAQGFDTVVSRAFASMSEIMKLTAHLLNENGLLLAMKGQRPDDELTALSQPYKVVPIVVPSVEAERCLVCISVNNQK
jgi:16S rRNA (guanine527-N7)-methyltransferase